MTRYSELQQAYMRSSERDRARLARLGSTTIGATAAMLRSLLRAIHEHLGCPSDADVVFFLDSDGTRIGDVPDLVPDMVPHDGNGFRVELGVQVKWPVDDGNHYATGVSMALEIIPITDQCWTVAFEHRSPYQSMMLEASDPATYSAFAEQVFGVVSDYFDTYALPPESPRRTAVGFVQRTS